jgi:hypothetical protein
LDHARGITKELTFLRRLNSSPILPLTIFLPSANNTPGQGFKGHSTIVANSLGLVEEGKAEIFRRAARKWRLGSDRFQRLIPTNAATGRTSDRVGSLKTRDVKLLIESGSMEQSASNSIPEAFEMRQI